jgi:hypothetical protein
VVKCRHSLGKFVFGAVSRGRAISLAQHIPKGAEVGERVPEPGCQPVGSSSPECETSVAAASAAPVGLVAGAFVAVAKRLTFKVGSSRGTGFGGTPGVRTLAVEWPVVWGRCSSSLTRTVVSLTLPGWHRSRALHEWSSCRLWSCSGNDCLRHPRTSKSQIRIRGPWPSVVIRSGPIPNGHAGSSTKAWATDRP